MYQCCNRQKPGAEAGHAWAAVWLQLSWQRLRQSDKRRGRKAHNCGTGERCHGKNMHTTYLNLNTDRLSFLGYSSQVCRRTKLGCCEFSSRFHFSSSFILTSLYSRSDTVCLDITGHMLLKVDNCLSKSLLGWHGGWTLCHVKCRWIFPKWTYWLKETAREEELISSASN